MEKNKVHQFSKVEKTMAWVVGKDAAIVFAEILGKEMTWGVKGRLSKQNIKGKDYMMFYTSLGDLNDETTLGIKTVKTARNVLIKAGLVVKKRQGQGLPNYYGIDHEVYTKMIEENAPLRQKAIEVRREKRKLKEEDSEGIFSLSLAKARGYFDWSYPTHQDSSEEKSDDASGDPVNSLIGQIRPVKTGHIRPNKTGLIPPTTNTNTKTNTKTNSTNTNIVDRADSTLQDTEDKSKSLDSDGTLGATHPIQDDLQKEKPSIPLPATKNEKKPHRTTPMGLYTDINNIQADSGDAYKELYKYLDKHYKISDSKPLDNFSTKDMASLMMRHTKGFLINPLYDNISKLSETTEDRYSVVVDGLLGITDLKQLEPKKEELSA